MLCRSDACVWREQQSAARPWTDDCSSTMISCARRKIHHPGSDVENCVIVERITGMAGPGTIVIAMNPSNRNVRKSNQARAQRDSVQPSPRPPRSIVNRRLRGIARALQCASFGLSASGEDRLVRHNLLPQLRPCLQRHIRRRPDRLYAKLRLIAAILAALRSVRGGVGRTPECDL
jgi:hypothetical protein